MQSVRVDLMRFFVRIDGGQASFGFETSDDHLDVPSGWNGYYYPSYIPTLFEMRRCMGFCEPEE